MPSLKKIFFFSIIALFAALGVYLGYSTVDRYKTIVQALLGLTVLYLLYKEFLSPKEAAKFPIKEAFEFPGDIKYLVYAFVLAVVMFWASIHVLHLFGI